jgi:hypothetical protein
VHSKERCVTDQNKSGVFYTNGLLEGFLNGRVTYYTKMLEIERGEMGHEEVRSWNKAISRASEAYSEYRTNGDSEQVKALTERMFKHEERAMERRRMRQDLIIDHSWAAKCLWAYSAADRKNAPGFRIAAERLAANHPEWSLWRIAQEMDLVDNWDKDFWE